MLLEIVIEGTGLIGNAGQGRVVPHGAQSLLAPGEHGSQQHLQGLGGISENVLALEKSCRLFPLRRLDAAQIVQRQPLSLHPRLVGLAGDIAVLEFGILDDAALFEIDEEGSARLQAALVLDILGLQRQSADLGTHHHPAVLGDDVARGTQPIAVEDRSDAATVGKSNRCRAIPGLEHARVVLVESTPGRIHILLVLPGLRDHHHHRMTEVPPGHVKEFQGIVELGRIAGARRHHGKDLLEIVAEQARFEGSLSRVHPVGIARQGVDLAIMREVTERLGKIPGRKGIGAIALVNQGEARFEIVRLEVRKELRRLVGEEHALVEQRLRGKTRNVKEKPPLDHLLLDQATNHVELSVEEVRLQALGRTDEDLLDDRHSLSRDLADLVGVRRHFPPTEQRLSLGGDGRRDDLLLPTTLRRIRREKDQRRRIGAQIGQTEPALIRHPAQKAIGCLQQKTRTISRTRVGSRRSPVSQMTENLRPHSDNVVARTAAQVGDKADSAGIVFQAGVVQALFRGQSEASHERVPGLKCVVGRRLTVGKSAAGSRVRDEPLPGSKSLSVRRIYVFWISDTIILTRTCQPAEGHSPRPLGE